MTQTGMMNPPVSLRWLAVILLVPMALFWLALGLEQMFSNEILMNSVFVPLDHSLAGKATTFLLLLAMPSAAVMCGVVEMLLRRRAGRGPSWIVFGITGFSLLSMSAILLHALTDR